jgi:hypothetical protein
LRAIIQKNLKSWEECLPLVEFAYNRTVHSTTGFSPFEIVYGFNPLTPMDLIPLPFEEKVSLNGEKKANMVRQLHEEVRLQIEKKNRFYASKANKGRKLVVFQPGDWVWVHMRISWSKFSLVCVLWKIQTTKPRHEIIKNRIKDN